MSKKPFFDKKKPLHWIALILVLLLVVPAVFNTYYNMRSELDASKAQPVERKPREKKEVPPPNAEELLTLVNEARALEGVAPLQLDPRLNASAERKASDMATYDYFGHENYDGGTGKDFIPAREMGCMYFSENLTQNTTVNSSRYAMFAFLASEPHRNAILNPDYDLVGFGVEENYVVQHFCDII